MSASGPLSTAPDVGPADAWSKALMNSLAEGEWELPAMPTAIGDALELLEDPGCDLQQVARILSRDAALAARALRSAVAVTRATRVPIQSLNEAVVRLGIVSLRELLALEAVRSAVYGDGHVPRRTLIHLWTHAARAARASRELARLARVDVEGALLVGLLHDVGRPLALGLLARIAAKRGDCLAPADLRASVDALHGPLGAMLVAEWDLPAHLGAAAEHHHAPEQESHFPEIALLAHLADGLAHLSLTQRVDRAQADHWARAAARYGLKPAEFGALLASDELDRPL